MVPRLSSMGLQAALAADARLASASSSTFVPISALAPSSTRSGVGATAPRPSLAWVQTPASSSVSATPAPTTAMSISVRGMKRR